MRGTGSRGPDTNNRTPWRPFESIIELETIETRLRRNNKKI